MPCQIQKHHPPLGKSGNMKYHLQAAAICLLVGVLGLRCTKSADPVKVDCFPTAISTSSTGVSSSVTYKYNGSNQVTATATTRTTGVITVVIQTTYTYDGDGNIIAASEIASSGSTTTRNYTYDIAHNLMQELVSVDGVPSSKTVYHYNSTLQLTGAEYTVYIGAGSNTTTSTYEYATPVARNPTKVASSQGATWRYEYDTRPNPLKVLFVSIQPDNNVTRLTYTPAGGGATQTVYTYQYDGNGYPASRSGTDGETNVYSYQCK
jgi:hypothetical protein